MTQTSAISSVQFARSPLPQLIIVALLVLLVPFAMTFHPAGGADDNSAVRVLMVAVGLLAPIVTLVLFVVAVRRRFGTAHYFAAASAVLAAFAVGWRCFPYWVSGVYQMDLGAAPWMDMDPKRLMPMIWIGEFWRLGVIVLALVTFVGTPILMGFSIRAAWLGQRSQLLYTTAFCAIAVSFHFLFQQDYMGWIMD
jgi:hypothetical protein